MKTGILRDDVTVKEFVYEMLAPNNPEQFISDIQEYQRRRGRKTNIGDYCFPESWYTDIKEDHKPCPRCGHDYIQIITTEDIHGKWRHAMCEYCLLRTEAYKTGKPAWEDWDRSYD
jgi:hypothetical protein